MIINLPEKSFEDRISNGTLVAFLDTQTRTLKLSSKAKFKCTMRHIVYVMHSGDEEGLYECAYNHEKFEKKEMSVDHIIPQYVGGPTITNNLVLANRKDNNEKGNMPLEIYEEYKITKDLKEAIRKSEIENEKLRKCKDFSFLGNWVTRVPVKKIKYVDGKLPKKYTPKYKEKMAYFKKYGRSPKPIIVDKNYNLLGGGAFLKFALDSNIRFVWVVVCENVELYNSKLKFKHEYDLYCHNLH